MANRPDYVDRAEERRNILNDLASLRDERKQLKRNLLVSNDCKNKVPPNPLGNFKFVLMFYLQLIIS